MPDDSTEAADAVAELWADYKANDTKTASG